MNLMFSNLFICFPTSLQEEKKKTTTTKHRSLVNRFSARLSIEQVDNISSKLCHT